MSRKSQNQYGEDFIIEDKEEANYNQFEKIKNDNNWLDDNEDDVYEEARKESHGYVEAITLLENLIERITSNDYIKANDDAWTIVYEAFNTLISRDTLGAYEKKLLEEWWVLRTDMKIQDPEFPEVFVNPMQLYYEFEEDKKLTKERK